MVSILSAVMVPIILHEQCQTQEMNKEEESIHLPSARFDIVANRISEDKEKEDCQIAISFNGISEFTPVTVLSNKTNTMIKKGKPSM